MRWWLSVEKKGDDLGGQGVRRGDDFRFSN